MTSLFSNVTKRWRVFETSTLPRRFYRLSLLGRCWTFFKSGLVLPGPELEPSYWN
jgi:hypothetical protein